MTQLPYADTQQILDCAVEATTAIRPELGTLLDLPCGSGYLSMRARERGWDVTPADIDTERWEGDPGLQVRYVDLHQALPFDDAQFDAVICCEGIEHVENPWHVLREFRRILRPNGLLTISLPNTIDIRQRIRMFWRGHVSHYYPHVPTHINVMGPFVLCQALERNGFTIQDIRAPQVYGNAITKLAAGLFPYRQRSELSEPVRKMLSNERILRTRNPVICAKLTEA